MEKIILYKKVIENKKEQIKNKFYKNIKINDKNELIIVTTAITRPELHKISFSNYAKNIPKDIPILWIINVDYVHINNSKNLNKLQVINETIDNIKSYFTDHDIRFKFSYSIKGHFNKAMRTVVKTTFESISKTTKYILNLEDDWFVENNFDLKSLMYKSFDIFRLNRILKRKNYSISFQPILLKPFVWYLVFYVSFLKNDDLNIDPEKICQKNKDFIDKYMFSYNSDLYFKDIGRDFLNSNSDLIRGWFQTDSEVNLSMSYIDSNILIKSIIYQYKSSKNSSNIDNFCGIIKRKLKELFRQSLLVIIQNKFEGNLEKFYDYYLNVNINNKLNDIGSIYNFIKNQTDNSNLIGA